MTPTEQDKELREKVADIQVEFLKSCGVDNLIPHFIDTDDNAGQAMRDKILQLITADRKRVALEARIDEISHVFRIVDGRIFWQSDISLAMPLEERIAELKAQQEEV